MRIIRYLSGQIVTAMLFIVVSMTCVIWLSQSLRFVDLIVNRGLPIPSFIFLTLMLMPTWLSIVLPIAAFAATLFVYNKMTNDREMVVLAAAGLSPLRLAVPALVVAVATTLAKCRPRLIMACCPCCVLVKIWRSAMPISPRMSFFASLVKV